MERGPWFDEEMCPQEGHSMPGGDDGVSQEVIFYPAWCKAIAHGLAHLCTFLSPRGKRLEHVHFTLGETTLGSRWTCLL